MQYTFITHINMNKSLMRNKYQDTKVSIMIGDNCYLGADQCF